MRVLEFPCEFARAYVLSFVFVRFRVFVCVCVHDAVLVRVCSRVRSCVHDSIRLCVCSRVRSCVSVRSVWLVEIENIRWLF